MSVSTPVNDMIKRDVEFKRNPCDDDKSGDYVVHSKQTRSQVRANGDMCHCTTRDAGLNADDYGTAGAFWEDNSKSRAEGLLIYKGDATRSKIQINSPVFMGCSR